MTKLLEKPQINVCLVEKTHCTKTRTELEYLTRKSYCVDLLVNPRDFNLLETGKLQRMKK